MQKLKRSNLLVPLDHTKIPNIKNLDSDYMNMSYDPHNKYSLPYFFGTVGILYNKDKYPHDNFNSWSDLYQSKYKNDILLVDGAREMMGMGLNKLGYSLNDNHSSHIKRAEVDLKS